MLLRVPNSLTAWKNAGAASTSTLVVAIEGPLTAHLRGLRHERDKASEEVAEWGSTSPLLWFFVESTSNYRLDPWQRKLCDRLQKLAGQVGQRILVHAPPQAGKSVIVSQRFPAWLLGVKPAHRVKLACYNITHAASFGGIVRDLMQESDYRALFPSLSVRVPEVASKESFSTRARARWQDGQPSFKALGLLTGFVGQGADTLLLDDPYSSPQDALSPTIRNSVWTFWTQGAKVRLNDHSNVVVMFHRYHEDDLAGKLWNEERTEDGGRKWEMLRFAAEADGDAEMPDPMGREIGERLSPRMSEAYITEQKLNPIVWAGQFQGRPVPLSGVFFDAAWFKRFAACPLAPTAHRVRYWDLAGAKPGKGDWTVGVLMFRDPATGQFWIEDIQRFQKPSNERNDTIVETAKADRAAYPGRVKTYIEQAPGLGKEATDTLIKLLAGFTAEADRVTKDKVTRAEDYKAQSRAGNVSIVEGPHVSAFLATHVLFPFGAHDDDVDAGSGAYNKIILPDPKKPVGYNPAALVGGFSRRT